MKARKLSLILLFLLCSSALLFVFPVLKVKADASDDWVNSSARNWSSYYADGTPRDFKPGTPYSHTAGGSMAPFLTTTSGGVSVHAFQFRYDISYSQMNAGGAYLPYTYVHSASPGGSCYLYSNGGNPSTLNEIIDSTSQGASFGSISLNTWYSFVWTEYQVVGDKAIHWNCSIYDYGYAAVAGHLLASKFADYYNGATNNTWDNSAGVLFGMMGNYGEQGTIQNIKIMNIDPTQLSADLEPMGGEGADWVFVDWRYYTFTATIPSSLYSGAIDQCYLYFYVPTGNGTILEAPYTNNNGNFSLLSNASSVSADRGLDPVRIADGSITTSASNTIIAYKIWFTSKCLDVYSATAGVDVNLVWNDTTGAASAFHGFLNFFRIYNKGGFSLHTIVTGNAGALPGGRDFSLFAYNNSYAYKDLIWRDLQHIKMLPTVSFRAGAQTFSVYYGLDYGLSDGTWVTGLECKLDVSYVSYTGVFTGNVWINMTCSWYDNSTLIKTDNLWMFYHGDVYNYPDPGRWQFWVDLWFDTGNASALQGGRINAYEFPMQDTSALWLRWLSSNWGVKDNVLKQSECITNLHDASGNPISSTEQILFVKVWSSVNVVPYDAEQYVAITDFSTFDTTLSSKYPLQGIQTPPWDETKMPTVGNTGLLGAVWSMFAGIGKWLSDNIIFGGLALWPTFVAFLDVIAGWLGMPHGFSNLITWLGTGWGWLVQSFVSGITVIYDIFLFLGSILVTLLSIMGQAIVSFVNVIGMITGFLTGGFGTGVNIWNQLGLTTWLTLGIILYPIYLVFLWDAKGTDAVVSQLTMVWGILSWLAHFFLDIIRTIITVISGVVESIPVVE